MHEMIKSERQTKQAHTERSQGKFGSFKVRSERISDLPQSQILIWLRGASVVYTLDTRVKKYPSARHRSVQANCPALPHSSLAIPTFTASTPRSASYSHRRWSTAPLGIWCSTQRSSPPSFVRSIPDLLNPAGHGYRVLHCLGPVFVGNTAQENCNNEFNLSGWRIGMGAFAFTFLLIGTAFWACLFTAWMLLRSKRNLGRLSELIKKARKEARRRQIEAGKSSSTRRDAAHRPKGGFGAPESEDEKEEREQERGVADGLDMCAQPHSRLGEATDPQKSLQRFFNVSPFDSLMYFILVAICHAPERFVRWRASKKARQWWRWGLCAFFASPLNCAH